MLFGLSQPFFIQNAFFFLWFFSYKFNWVLSLFRVASTWEKLEWSFVKNYWRTFSLSLFFFLLFFFVCGFVTEV